MAVRFNKRLASVVIFIVLAMAIHVGFWVTDTVYPSWWVLLNFVPILLGFAVESVGHQEGEIGVYIGLIIQWAILGYLAEYFYTKYIYSKPG